MHADIRQLLNLRDGAPVAVELAQHVQSCPLCTRELARLEDWHKAMQSLPAKQPDAGAWERIAAHARGTRGKSRRMAAAGLAAGIALAAALVSLQPPEETSYTVPVNTADNLDGLMRESRQLETLLTAMQPQHQVVSASIAGAIVELEDSIALVDMQLNHANPAVLTAQQREQLWQRRVDLMQSLVTVHSTQLRATTF